LFKKNPEKRRDLVRYAKSPLNFNEKIPANTKLRLDIKVDLRQRVHIKAFPRKQIEKASEVIVPRPLS